MYDFGGETVLVTGGTKVIVFVASDRASYTTGSEVRVDGGRLA